MACTCHLLLLALHQSRLSTYPRKIHRHLRIATYSLKKVEIFSQQPHLHMIFVLITYLVWHSSLVICTYYIPSLASQSRVFEASNSELGQAPCDLCRNASTLSWFTSAAFSSRNGFGDNITMPFLASLAQDFAAYMKTRKKVSDKPTFCLQGERKKGMWVLQFQLLLGWKDK